MSEQYYIYILTNKFNSVFYTGVTNDLKRRIFEHKNEIVKSFSSKYGVKKLVYYEVFGDSYNAICREKQIKAGSRQDKINLVDSMNKEWNDLYDGL